MNHTGFDTAQTLNVKMSWKGARVEHQTKMGDTDTYSYSWKSCPIQKQIPFSIFFPFPLVKCIHCINSTGIN
jgi:hypothetical protein